MRRMAVARALVTDSDFIFADEPTGALNSSSGQDVLDVFTELHKNGQSIVMVTHDLKTALRGSRVLYLKDGKVEGEYRMSVYGSDDLKKRKDCLQSFLNGMGW